MVPLVPDKRAEMYDSGTSCVRPESTRCGYNLRTDNGSISIPSDRIETSRTFDPNLRRADLIPSADSRADATYHGRDTCLGVKRKTLQISACDNVGQDGTGSQTDFLCSTWLHRRAVAHLGGHAARPLAKSDCRSKPDMSGIPVVFSQRPLPSV
jgi:hypothetical protein